MEITEDMYKDPTKVLAALGAGKNLPVPQMMSLSEANQRARKYARQIFSTQADLVQILDRHELVLYKRWLKKTAAQRCKVLTTVYPNMPDSHRPDVQVMRKETEAQTRAGTSFRNHFLFPSLNLEDLSKPRNLLLLIKSRARTAPGKFVNADINSIHIGLVSQGIVPVFLNCFTMYLSAQDNSNRYGRITSWDDDNTAFDKMMAGEGLQPGEGLLAMEIQQKTLDFLLACVKVVLQDLDLEDVSLPKQPSVDQSMLDKYKPDWPSLPHEREELPYKVPDILDFSRLEVFLYARKTEAEDLVWALREDPAYFQEQVMEWTEHMHEGIPYEDGKSDRSLFPDKFWNLALHEFVSYVYQDVVLWHMILSELKGISAQIERLSSQQRKNQQLSKKLRRSLAEFEFLVEQCTKPSIGLWTTGVPASPPLRHLFVRKPVPASPSRFKISYKKPVRKKDSYILWLLQLVTQDDQLFLLGLENFCDELEREIRTNQASKDKITPWVYHYLSDMSLLGEIKRQIGQTTPGHRMVDVVMEGEREELLATRAKMLKDIDLVFAKGQLKLGERWQTLSKLSYPSHRSASAANTQKMQTAEKCLHEFWAKFDDSFVQRCGKTANEMLKSIMATRPIQRTPDWKEPAHQPRKNHRDQDVDPDSTRLAALELEKKTESTITGTSISQVPERQKVKTRGIPHTSSSDGHTNATEADADDQPDHPVFKVSKRGIRVFRALFHVPTDALTAESSDESGTPGEIPWTDFLSAMASVGFSMKKLDGSAWVFAPVRDDFHRSIIFHEPHPSSKMPYNIARRFGRRLERVFGWNVEWFERG